MVSRLVSVAIASCLLSCGSMPKAPNAWHWGVNGPKMWLEGYNLLEDYDSDGNLKPDAKKSYFPFTDVKDLNAAIIILPPGKYPGDEGTKGALRWRKEIRLWGKDHCK